MIQHVRIGPSRAKILLDVLIFLKAIQLLLAKRYDVIHSHEEASFFSMFLAWLFRTRHLYDMHSVLSRQLGNFDFGNKPVFVKIFGLLETMVLKTCDAVITVGTDIEKYFDHNIGVTVNPTPAKDIRLWFSPLQGNYIKTQPQHTSQNTISNDASGLIISLKLIPNYELLQTLLSFGPEVKVLEPLSLQEQMKEMVKKTMKLYEQLSVNS